MAIPKTRSAREKNLILSPQNNPRFPLKNIFTAHSLCTSLYFGTFIVHKPLSTMHCGQISPQCFLACIYIYIYIYMNVCIYMYVTM